MSSFVCAILCFICFGIVGIITFIDGQKNKVSMRITPWDPKISWLIFSGLMISTMNWAFLAFKFMQLEG